MNIPSTSQRHQQQQATDPSHVMPSSSNLEQTYETPQGTSPVSPQETYRGPSTKSEPYSASKDVPLDRDEQGIELKIERSKTPTQSQGEHIANNRSTQDPGSPLSSHHHYRNPYNTNSDTTSSYDADSILAPSTIRDQSRTRHHIDSEATSIAPTEITTTTADENASLHSRSAFLPAHQRRRTHSTANPFIGDHLSPNQHSDYYYSVEPVQQRRATVAYLADLKASRQPQPKPKKTTSRKAFELFCDVVDIVMPIDVDENKTSMRESSLSHLVHKDRDGAAR